MSSRSLRVFKCYLASILVTGVFLGAWWGHLRPESAIFEVADTDAPVKEAEAPEFQVLTIQPYSKTFAEGFERYAREPATKMAMAYAPDAPNAQDVALSPAIVQRPGKRQVHAPQKLTAENSRPKPEAKVKVASSSDNWAQMSGLERWKFVAAYVRSMHWKCPPSGMSKASEIAKLSPPYVTWGMVLNMGLNNCVAAKAEQAGR